MRRGIRAVVVVALLVALSATVLTPAPAEASGWPVHDIAAFIQMIIDYALEFEYYITKYWYIAEDLYEAYQRYLKLKELAEMEELQLAQFIIEDLVALGIPLDDRITVLVEGIIERMNVELGYGNAGAPEVFNDIFPGFSWSVEPGVANDLAIATSEVAAELTAAVMEQLLAASEVSVELGDKRVAAVDLLLNARGTNELLQAGGILASTGSEADALRNEILYSLANLQAAAFADQVSQRGRTAQQVFQFMAEVKGHPARFRGASSSMDRELRERIP